MNSQQPNIANLVRMFAEILPALSSRQQPRTQADNILGSRPHTIPTKLSMPIDIVYEEKSIYIYAELAGVQKETITIDVYNSMLTISAEKIRSYDNPRISEIKFGKLERVINLPICITHKETLSSTFQNGLLKIKIDRLIEEANRFSVQPTDE